MKILLALIALLAFTGVIIGQATEKTIELSWTAPVPSEGNVAVTGYEIDCVGQSFSVGLVTSHTLQSNSWGEHTCSIASFGVNESGDVLRSDPTLSNTFVLTVPLIRPNPVTSFTAEVK